MREGPVMSSGRTDLPHNVGERWHTLGSPQGPFSDVSKSRRRLSVTKRGGLSVRPDR